MNVHAVTIGLCAKHYQVYALSYYSSIWSNIQHIIVIIRFWLQHDYLERKTNEFTEKMFLYRLIKWNQRKTCFKFCHLFNTKCFDIQIISTNIVTWIWLYLITLKNKPMYNIAIALKKNLCELLFWTTCIFLQVN